MLTESLSRSILSSRYLLGGLFISKLGWIAMFVVKAMQTRPPAQILCWEQRFSISCHPSTDTHFAGL